MKSSPDSRLASLPLFHVCGEVRVVFCRLFGRQHLGYPIQLDKSQSDLCKLAAYGLHRLLFRSGLDCQPSTRAVALRRKNLERVSVTLL